MIIIIGVLFTVAAVYHGINFILLFKQSLPVIVVTVLMGISFVLALPFVPYASVYSAWRGGLHWAYSFTLFALYTLFVAISIAGIYSGIYLS